MDSKRLVNIFKAVFVVAVLAALFFASSGSYTDPSTWRHALMGKEFMKDMNFPAGDNLSYAGGAKWDRSAWVFDIFTYAAAFIAGMARLKYLKLIFFILIAGMMFMTAFKKQSGKYLTITTGVGLFGLILIDYYLKISPSAFSMLFAAYFVFVLEQEPSKRSDFLYYSLPFISIFWANMDTTAAAGPLLILVYVVYYIIDMMEVPEKKEKYNSPAILIALLLSSAATLLSPSFTRAYTVLINHFSGGAAAWLTFVRTGPAEKLQAALLAVYLLILIFVIIMNERGPEKGKKAELVRDATLTAVFIALCAADMSYVPVFLAVSVPIAMYYTYLIFRWGFVWPRKWTETDMVRIKNLTYIILIPLVAAYCLYKYMEPKSSIYPDKAIAYIMNAKPAKNLFVPVQWTGYTGYYLPAYKFLWDGNQQRPEDVKREYEIITKGSLEISPIIERHSINTFLLPSGWPLNEKLKSLGFKTAYFDDESTVLVNPSSGADYFKYIAPGASTDFYDRANYVTALAEAAGFAEKYPSQAAHKMAAALYMEKDRKKAIDYLENTINDFPQEDGLNAELGKAYYDEGEYESAIEAFEEVKEPDAAIKQQMKAAKLKLNRADE
jgi:hypothetical protein